MAVSELQSRLEHLVSYSSQLIFVSGETVGEQQRSLEAFISHQNEMAEIAFLNAKADCYEQQYRRLISRQLLRDESGLFNRPLNELLAPLNHHEGPVLICICQAELLPPSFLQELWDLVLQSRFANNKQHLNVILFGKSAWAEQAKAWLPAKNRDKPVLLSNESITQPKAPDSALDRLIANKRQLFEQRLIERAQPRENSPSTLQAWWFRGLLILTFLASFSGLLLWQYSDAIPDLWTQPANIDPPTAESPPPATDLIPELEAAVEVVDSSESEQPADMFMDEDQTPVVDWQTAVADMKLGTETMPKDTASQNESSSLVGAESTPPFGDSATNSTQSESILESIPTATDLDKTLSETSPASGNQSAFSANEIEDYQVEDITSVNQLAKEITPEILAPSDTQEAAATSNDAFILANLDADLYVIQIAGISNQQVVDEFVTDNKLSENLWIYTTQRFGGDWHVLLNRQTFGTQLEARTYLAALPESMQRGTPFVKSVRQVQAELNSQ